MFKKKKIFWWADTGNKSITYWNRSNVNCYDMNVLMNL